MTFFSVNELPGVHTTYAIGTSPAFRSGKLQKENHL